MKKITTLAVAFVMAMGMNAQEVSLKPEFKANTTYTQTEVQNNKIAITYEGADEPMEQEAPANVTRTIEVGKLTNNELPFTITMAVDPNQQGAEMLNGAKILGKVKGGKLAFESVDAPNMPDQVKDMIKSMMEQAFLTTFFPAKKMKVGESFAIDIPMEIPVGPGISMDMKDVATFRLKKVEGRKAIFDVNHVITLQANVEGQDMKGSGTGSGEMVYDLDQNYPVANTATVTMDMGFEAQGMQINMKVTNDTKTTTVITTKK
ncbi:DUF6263 family protein [Flavobacterium sp. MFBS3-15]|uniref:DUF6263 family protein n=1 Tax=Flavobacterium sp. MFBS3-15 TaxID=2989816 RepID=UPI002235D090|nr:DUF6263 family protein [Flavobacterium sp. MFBS3-15]MCW4469055.1 DUF6263 family protein [Flavobacterium sp. MFBS3-15]